MQISTDKKPIKKDDKSASDKTIIGKAAIGLSIIAIVSKVFGFAEKLIVAHFFGTDARADVYFAAMGIILSIVFLIKELIYPTVIPVFAQALKISFHASSGLFKKLFFRLLFILVCFTIIAMFFSDVITNILVLGFSEDKKLLTSSLLRFLAPACLFMCLMTFTQSVLNCRRNFFKAAIPEAGFKLFIAIGLIILIPLMNVYALVIVALAGSILAFCLQFIFIPESKACLAYSAYEANDGFARILKLMGPLVLGVVFSHISGLVDNMLASTLPTGQLSYLGYSKKLIDAFLFIGPVALVTVVYSQMSHLAAEGKFENFRFLFIKVLRLILFVSIPAAIILVMLREPVVAALFERGKFTHQSTFGTSRILFIYAVGLVTFAVEVLVVYSFYALSNTKAPVKIGIFAVIIDIILSVTLVGPFGIAAIAWAYVFSKTLKVVILLLVMDIKLKFLRSSVFINFLLKIIISCTVSAFCLYLLRNLNQNSPFLQKFVFDLAVPAAGFTAAFLLCSRLFRIEELNLLSAVVVRRKNLKSELMDDIS